MDLDGFTCPDTNNQINSSDFSANLQSEGNRILPLKIQHGRSFIFGTPMDAAVQLTKAKIRRKTLNHGLS